MKVIIDIPEKKAGFILELLKNFSYLKTKPLSSYKAQVFEDLKEAVEEVKLARKGKVKLKTLDELINEL